MAAALAPTLSGGEISNTLRHNKQQQTKKAKQKAAGNQSKKITKKNILLSPYSSVWPAVNEETEGKVLDFLVKKLEEFPRLCPEPEKGRTADSADKAETDNAENDLIRRRLRSQLALGHRQVSKHLERNELSLLLVWGGAQPSLITDSLLPLAATRSCPALCLRKLVPRVTTATGLTSLVALGFKKPQPGLDDFKDFITMAEKLACPLKLPLGAGARNDGSTNNKADADDDDSHDDDEDDVEDDDGMDDGQGNNSADADVKVKERTTVTVEEKSEQNASQNIDWPVVAESEERQILDKLSSLLSPYKDVLKVRRKKFQNAEWKAKRATLRTHILTDPATVRDAAKLGKVTLLLMQKDKLPNRNTAAAAISAVKGGCPVLCLSHLKEVMSPVLRNPVLSAIAFRKCEEAKQKEEFSDFVTFAKQFASKDLKTLLPVEKEKPVPAEKKGAAPAAKAPKKPPIPIYDVSHLYVYETDTKKSVTQKQVDDYSGYLSLDTKSSDLVSKEREPEKIKERQPEATAKRKVTLSQPTLSYISLSSKPDVLSSSKSTKIESMDLTSAFIDTKGSSVKPLSSSGNKHETENVDETDTSHVSFTGILGMDEETASVTSSVPFIPESGTTKRNAKSALKRKLENSKAAGEYVSFKFSPTVVQASTSNPNKVKKNKKKRK